MKLQPKVLTILTVVAVLCVLGIPGAAHAQLDGSAQAALGKAVHDSIDDCNKNTQNNVDAVAQQKTAAAYQVYSGMARVDAAAYSCLDQIDKALDALNLIVSNPADVFRQIFWNMVIGLIQQTCSIALGGISQFKNFVVGQFNRLCVPLPNLNLNINGSLNLPTPPCNGVNILNPQFTASGTTQRPGTWTLWNVDRNK